LGKVEDFDFNLLLLLMALCQFMAKMVVA